MLNSNKTPQERETKKTRDACRIARFISPLAPSCIHTSAGSQKDEKLQKNHHHLQQDRSGVPKFMLQQGKLLCKGHLVMSNFLFNIISFTHLPRFCF